LRQSKTPREIELKLRLPSGSRSLLEASGLFAGTPTRVIHQVTTYFDTVDHALDRLGLTLRVRKAGAARIQTVKSRSNERGIVADRGEWEWPIAKDIPDISLLRKVPVLAAAAHTADGTLERLFVTDIRRTVRLLRLEDETVVEAAIDEGAIVAGRKREPVSELELELKSGHVEAIYRLAAALQALAPMWISPESKAARGWHLLMGNAPTAQSAEAPNLTRATGAAQGFHDILGESLGHLVANISPTLCGDSEGLHQMRMALRSTRAALNLFQGRLKSPAVARYDVQLRRFALIFGTARDWDVFCLTTLPAAVSELGTKGLRGLRAAADVQRQAALAIVRAVIQGHDFTALILSLALWAEAGARRPSLIGDHRMGKRLLNLAPSMLDRAKRTARSKARHPTRLSGEELHRLRKSVKKLSSDVESLSGLFPQHSIREYCGGCQRTLKTLGKINDAAVTRRLVQQLLTDSRANLKTSAAAVMLWSKRGETAARHGLEGALRAFKAEPAFWSQ
jgi:inorganic triphosphatase YgiF